MKIRAAAPPTPPTPRGVAKTLLLGSRNAATRKYRRMFLISDMRVNELFLRGVMPGTIDLSRVRGLPLRG